jgi:hypothetical protein
MLKINNLEHFKRVCDFAEKKGQKHFDDLWSGLWQLHTLGRDLKDDSVRDMPPVIFGQNDIPEEWFSRVKGITITELSKDFAPASFSFYSMRFSGGFIYRGDQSGWVMPNGLPIPEGYGVETFSVSFGDTRLWTINT